MRISVFLKFDLFKIHQRHGIIQVSFDTFRTLLHWGNITILILLIKAQCWTWIIQKSILGKVQVESRRIALFVQRKNYQPQLIFHKFEKFRSNLLESAKRISHWSQIFAGKIKIFNFSVIFHFAILKINVVVSGSNSLKGRFLKVFDYTFNECKRNQNVNPALKVFYEIWPNRTSCPIKKGRIDSLDNLRIPLDVIPTPLIDEGRVKVVVNAKARPANDNRVMKLYSFDITCEIRK